jgi:hypothetical protein
MVTAAVSWGLWACNPLLGDFAVESDVDAQGRAAVDPDSGATPAGPLDAGGPAPRQTNPGQDAGAGARVVTPSAPDDAGGPRDASTPGDATVDAAMEATSDATAADTAADAPDSAMGPPDATTVTPPVDASTPTQGDAWSDAENLQDGGPPAQQVSVDASSDSACPEGGCAVCSAGAMQCASDVDLQTCDPSGQWGPSLPCPFVCSGGACAGVCSPGASQCGPSAGLGVLATQTCDASGQWGAPSACCHGCNSEGTACAADPCASECTRVASGDPSCAAVSGAAYPYYWVCTGSCAADGPSSCGNNGTAQGASRLNTFPAGAFCGSCSALCAQ